MLKELLTVDPGRWIAAKFLDGGDPLQTVLLIRCSRPVEDPVWVALKNVIRPWTVQNDCVAKDIRRYKDRVEVELLLKYEGRESNFSPHEPLPLGERLWRKANKL